MQQQTFGYLTNIPIAARQTFIVFVVYCVQSLNCPLHFWGKKQPSKNMESIFVMVSISGAQRLWISVSFSVKYPERPQNLNPRTHCCPVKGLWRSSGSTQQRVVLPRQDISPTVQDRWSNGSRIQHVEWVATYLSDSQVTKTQMLLHKIAISSKCKEALLLNHLPLFPKWTHDSFLLESEQEFKLLQSVLFSEI